MIAANGITPRTGFVAPALILEQYVRRRQLFLQSGSQHTGNDSFTVSPVAAAPEPSSLLLLALALSVYRSCVGSFAIKSVWRCSSQRGSRSRGPFYFWPLKTPYTPGTRLHNIQWAWFFIQRGSHAYVHVAGIVQLHRVADPLTSRRIDHGIVADGVDCAAEPIRSAVPVLC